MAGVARGFLLIFNVLYVLFGIALTACSIWIFVEIKTITDLRNPNHYLLDYNVYWPQVIPWLFFIVGVFVLSVSACGLTGGCKRSRSALVIYTICMCVLLFLIVAAVVIALVFADNSTTDNFIKDSILDAYDETKNDRDTAGHFSQLEKKLQCCGASSPRDYKNWRGDSFPDSCCDTYYHGFTGPYVMDCSITNKLANERHGCAEVASRYFRVAIKVFSGSSIFIAFIGILSLVAAISMNNSMKRKVRHPPPQIESESKKVLL